VSPADAWFSATCTSFALHDAAVIVAALTVTAPLRSSVNKSVPAIPLIYRLLNPV
jgi:cyanate lyase